MHFFLLVEQFLNVDPPMAGTVKLCNLSHPIKAHPYLSKKYLFVSINMIITALRMQGDSDQYQIYYHKVKLRSRWKTLKHKSLIWDYID